MTTLQQFNSGQSVTSTIATSGAVFGAVNNAVGTASRLGSAISSALSTGDVVSAIRSINLPAAGEAVGSVLSAVSMFSNTDNPNDFRVRLSLANWSSFTNSPVLKPLKDAGGLIFPYTPAIQMRSAANYGHEPTVHNNYPVTYYKNSDPGTITIDAPMHVEDPTQALYWIAALHYLKSLTKMFEGYDALAGNPPPIVYLNGYGNYVLKNIPVVVESVTAELNADSDYISTNVVGTEAGNISNIADSVGGLASTIGGAIPGLSGITSAISSIAGGVGQVSSMLSAYNIGDTVNGGLAYVPTKSNFNVVLRPVYSRQSIRQFSLDQFVSGGYINNYFGYL